MLSTAEPETAEPATAMDECCATHLNLLDEPEHEVLLRLSGLVSRVFRVPAAYLALLGPGLTVTTRVGSGSRYWDNLKTYPLARALANPVIWPDPAGEDVPGFVSGEIRFAAAAPLRSSDGLELGVLVIADVEAHPQFLTEDLETLAELAGILAGKMELRMMACQARDSEALLREAEGRFRNIANYAPVMIIYSGVDGGAVFVNKAWLDFTGRRLEDELGTGYAETFHPDFRGRAVETYWDAFQLRKSRTVQFPMRRHDGEYRWMEARGVPRFLDDGSYAGFVGCCIDLGQWRQP